MGSAMGMHERNRMHAPLSLTFLLMGVCLGLVSNAGLAEELQFCALEQGQYSLPNPPAPILEARQSGKGMRKNSRSGDMPGVVSSPRGIESYRLAQEDYQARMQKRPHLHQEVWTVPSGEPKAATLCVIHDLTETAGITFLISSPTETQADFAIRLPKGPNLGPFSLQLNGKEIGTLDPWAREKVMPEWVSLPEPVTLKAGNNSLTILQRSPQDLPIWLEALRITSKNR